jgi:hypothetical protein
MDKSDKSFSEGLVEVEKKLQSAEYLTNVVYPAVKDTKLLLRALESLSDGVVKNISFILKYEHINQRIELGSDKNANLKLFYSKCAANYCTESDKQGIQEILKLREMQKKEAMEFSRSTSAVMYDDEMNISVVSLQKVKGFIGVSRRLFENTNRKLSIRKV